jgi:hypothetical protein
MSKLETDILQKLHAKNITPNSIKFYMNNLKLLNNNEIIKNLKFLDNPKTILDKLKHLSPVTQRGYIIGICSILKALDRKTLYAKYYKLMMEMNKNYAILEQENKKTQKEKENWIEWPDVLKIQQQLFNRATINNKYEDLLCLVAISLYTYLPPRRNKDYVECYITQDNQKNDNKHNYLVIDGDNMHFVFNNYKTAKTHGQNITEIPTELKDILNIYMTKHPLLNDDNIKDDIPLLVNKDGNKLNSSNGMTMLLNKVFGGRVSSTMLRHSFISHKYAHINQDQKDTAKQMGHSVSQQRNYIKV